LDGFSLVG